MSQRSLPIIEMLENDPSINLIRLPALMVKEEADLEKLRIEVLRRSFFIIEGRELSLGEIGCAASHNLARKLLSESQLGGIILEDDARIYDLNRLKEISRSFLQLKSGTKSILSLTGLLTSEIPNINQKIDSTTWYRVLGNTPLAVANLLTPGAAADLLEFNSPIRYVADWPYSKSHFYSVKIPIVGHGDASTVSTIDFSGSAIRNKPSVKFQISRFLFLPYIFTKHSNISFLEFTNWVYIRRISHYINRFLLLPRKSKNV